MPALVIAALSHVVSTRTYICPRWRGCSGAVDGPPRCGIPTPRWIGGGEASSSSGGALSAPLAAHTWVPLPNRFFSRRSPFDSIAIIPVHDLRVRIRPGGQEMHFEDSGANRGRRRPLGFKDVAYDVTIAATQTFNNAQYTATPLRREVPVRRRKPPSQSNKIRGAAGSSTRHDELSCPQDPILQYCNNTGTRWSKYPYLDNGWPYFGH